ncbi:hypothetical protein [Mycobacterium intracellulare]|uniref:phage fiber-tail adaptor protein n=1 Tax=Mycobacterium intracellulare TaxID=1767 RepID=UPI0019368AE6|nr:hypothetical protein [Mycobacterium intracellulare]BCP29620.1 hypothetical protein MINTM026_05900 [Mycobacterium intracellulare]
MAVTFDSSATSIASVAGSATTGSTAATHNVSPSAPNPAVVAAVEWVGTVDATGATFAVEFGGHAMTPVPNSQVFWNSNTGMVALFYLLNPPTGPQTVTASVSGMGTESGARTLALATASYSGVSGIGSAATASGASAALAVTSPTAPLFFNAFGCTVAAGGDSFASYNQTSRANIASVASTNQPLLIGDGAGSGLVDFTATAPAASEEWAGAGVGLLGNDVSFDAVGSAAAAGYLAAGSIAHTLAADATALLAAVNIYNTAPVTLTAEVGTKPMTLLDSQSYGLYSSNPWLYPFGQLALFGVIDPPTGAQTVKINSTAPVYMTAQSASYIGALGFDTAAASNGALSQLTVPSTKPAARLVAAHGITPRSNAFTYAQTKRAIVNASSADQLLLLGDAPGAPYVVSAAAMSSYSPDWGAAAVNLLPAPVTLNVSAFIGPIATSARLADYRSHTPSAIRTYVVPTANTAVVTSYGRVGPQWTQPADAVLDYTIDWSLWLAETGDSIASATFTPADPAISVISVNTTTTQATGWLTGGVNGSVYPVVVHIVTEYGRQFDQTFNLIIQQT